MIRPTLRCAALHAFNLALIIVLLLVRPDLWGTWLIVLGLIVLISALDLVSFASSRRLQWLADMPKRVFLNGENALRCAVTNTNPRGTIRGTIALEVKGALRHIESIRWSAPAGDPTTIDIPIDGWRRGAGHVSKLDLRWQSPIGLFEKRRKLPCEDLQTRVVSDLGSVQQAASHNSSLESYLRGLKTIRRIGDGDTFDAIRSFQPGHDTRAIDWSVSARMRELHVREFREEQTHNIVIAVDTGRLMARNVGKLTRLDYGLNASLHLAYVALRLSDRVGMFGFDSETRVWRAPAGGIQTLSGLTDAAQNLPYTLNTPDFRAGFTELGQHLRRRSIIFIITAIDGQFGRGDLLQALGPLRKKHQVNLIAVGRPDRTADYARVAPAHITTALAAASLQREREGTLRAIGARGIRTVDAQPDTLVRGMLEAYYEIKRRGLA